MPSTGERILVVESDPDISHMIARQALKPLGYDVKVVERASQAIEEALLDPPDLIIANLSLPDLGGKDVLAAISAKGVSAPVVVIAAKGDERRAIQAFRLGAVDALLWPARDAEIVRVVERAIQPTRSRRVRRQLYQQLEATQEDLRRKSRDLGGILSINKAVSSGTDQRQLFARLLEGAIQLAQADMAWVTLKDEKTGSYLLRAHRNLPAGWAKKLNQKLEDGLSSLVIVSGRGLAIHGQPLQKFKIAALGKSAAVLPVKVRREVLGMLIVVRRADTEIDSGVQGLLEALADLASISLLNARLFQAVESAGSILRRRQGDRKALVEALREALDRLERLQSGGAGTLTKEQTEAWTSVRDTLQRLLQAGGTDEPARRVSDS